MANTVLQWQSHVTDSTDREVILGNIDLLEKFAKAINGGDEYTISDGTSQVTGMLSTQFNLLRSGIKNGTLKPASWKDSEPFGKITTALTNASSGKIKELGDGADKLIKRVGDAEGDIKSHGERLDTAEGDITDHGTRIKDAEDALGNKLDSSIFEKFKTDDFKTITDWKSDLDKKLPSFASASELEDVRTLINKEVSHWTAESTPQPLKFTAEATVKDITQPWGKGEDLERHADDLCTVIGEKNPNRGISYRFVKHPTEDTYKWLKVIDNDGILALQQHTQFLTTYNEDKRKQKESSDSQQEEINDLKEKFGVSNDELTEINNKIREDRKDAAERDKQYKVVVSTKGYIKDGVIVNGGNVNGTPVIVHTAHVYDNFGHEKTIEARNKLTWTINKGRTTKPVEKTVTGLVCEVSQDQFVNDGTNPHYYDVELNSTF